MPQEAFGHILYGSWRVVFAVICGGGLVGWGIWQYRNRGYENISISTGWKIFGSHNVLLLGKLALI